MSNEINVQASLKITNGLFKMTRQGGGSFSFDQAVAGGMVPGTVVVGTTEEDIDLSELTTFGWVWMQNIDETNYVQWGPKSTVMVPMGRLEPGEPALFRVEPGVTLTMKANTAACSVLILACED